MENSAVNDRIKEYLVSLYGEENGLQTWSQLESSLEKFQEKNFHLADRSTLDELKELDVLLITYADQFRSPDSAHLRTLAKFVRNHLKGITTAVHLLPFFPYSSDDGFSVIDYQKVDPEIGKWEDLDPLRDCCRLMFDAVINHISSQSDWFQAFLQDKEQYRDYFLTVDADLDLSKVVRPRAKPLLTEVSTPSGPKHVWTTFSPDQIDLNYKNPAVLLEIIDILLFYIQKGARIIRLDAIAYLWKRIGTNCIHLPQTHLVIKLFRAVLDAVAPGVILITETNVPHEENISYFGEEIPVKDKHLSRGDEAQMVYQFPLAPLVLHTFRSGNAEILTKWAKSINVPYPSAAFLNFIASHDGIGVRPAEGLLSTSEIQELVNQTLAHGGQVSYKTNQDGTQGAYELNITLYDILNQPEKTPLDLGIKRFMASQAIMLSMAGVPGIYIHSLFGSSNCHSCVEQTGRARSINRKKYQLKDIEQELTDKSNRTFQVFDAYTHYLKIRKEQRAFNPLSPQEILEIDQRVFAILRSTADGTEMILCLINICDQDISLSINKKIGNPNSFWTDLLGGNRYKFNSIELHPYQVLWLKKE